MANKLDKKQRLHDQAKKKPSWLEKVISKIK